MFMRSDLSVFASVEDQMSTASQVLYDDSFDSVDLTREASWKVIPEEG